MPRRARLEAHGAFQYIIMRNIKNRRIVDDFADCRDFSHRLGLLTGVTKTVIFICVFIKFFPLMRID